MSPGIKLYYFMQTEITLHQTLSGSNLEPKNLNEENNLIRLLQTAYSTILVWWLIFPFKWNASNTFALFFLNDELKKCNK